MEFFKNIFGFDKGDAKNKPLSESKISSESELGEFSLKDFPKDDRHKKFYFYEYSQKDGEWVDIDQPICKIRIGEHNGLTFSAAIIKSTTAGVLERTLQRDDLLTKGKVYYKLHPKGEYQNENIPENFEYKEYFKGSDYKNYFDKWLVNDGAYVNIREPVFQFSDSKFKEHKNHSKKSGFVHQADPKQLILLEKSNLMYTIRETDDIRIRERYNNKANVITDEFTNSTIIKWHRVSSRSEKSNGIETRSDNHTTDLLFTFNYIYNNDYIVFHFNPKQIRPKQFDKVNFLFENGEQIQFELATNPKSSKNNKNEKILEYRGLITKSELDLFASSNFKKWKISLISHKRDILGGETSNDEFYPNKNNIQIAIKKFTNDYLELVKERIPDYQPTILKSNEKTEELTTDFCFVYLMHDTSNDYYKIGISNSPEYREKTLQSEKPTIEMITSKKFPVRKIAESIEKALHHTYSSKRLRGEWFELNLTDIEHIRETLQ